MLKILTTRLIFKKADFTLSARRYMRSISESALLYRPSMVELPHDKSIKDRVVQEFFDSSSLKHRIKVF